MSSVIINQFSLFKTVTVAASRASRAPGYTISPTTGFVMNCNKLELQCVDYSMRNITQLINGIVSMTTRTYKRR